MKTFILDAETFYSRDYTLRIMTPAEYILDHRFEITGCAVKELGCNPFWVEGPEVEAFLRSLDPANTTTISHNALFDNCIWSYRYGFVPALMVCTLGMSRALLNLKANSLGAVAKALGLPEAKGSEIAQAIGMTLADLKARPDFYQAYIRYALKDARLCEGIYANMVRKFPASEFFVQDLVLRAAVQPVLHADIPLLTRHLELLRKKKARLLRESNYDKASLMSTDRFRAALEELGVMIETKISATGNEVPAFAKSDAFMEKLQDYQEGDDETNFKVQTLAAARLSHKSTIEETRAERFLNIARLPWQSHQPLLPVPLRYGGAHTGRLSGEWRMNLQNLPRDQRKSSLRSALVAPPGFRIVAADLAQIEARIVACICGQHELIEKFKNSEDVYAWFASQLFNKPVSKETHPNERFIGKTAILGLGYGCGHGRFFQMVTSQARQYGIDISGLFNGDTARKAVDAYRSIFPKIPSAWRTLDLHLRILNSLRKDVSATFGPVRIESGRIILPNSMALRYDPLPNPDLYGAKLLENIVQALARIIIMDAALRLEDIGLRFVLQAHDELVFCLPEQEVPAARKLIMAEMIKVPVWMPKLPLEAEIGVGNNYGETK